MSKRCTSPFSCLFKHDSDVDDYFVQIYSSLIAHRISGIYPANNNLHLLKLDNKDKKTFVSIYLIRKFLPLHLISTCHLFDLLYLVNINVRFRFIKKGKGLISRI